MSLQTLAEMMDAASYPFTIIVDDVLSEADTAFVFNAVDEEPIAMVTLTPNDDFTIKAGEREFTFVDATDVIMWIVQNLS